MLKHRLLNVFLVCSFLPLNASASTREASKISKDYKKFFEEGILQYIHVHPSFAKRLSLWHVAISKLDIPDKEDSAQVDCGGDRTFDLLNQLLSTIAKEIGSAAYPDPKNPTDPNQDWQGRADFGFREQINRFNHDTLNHMRSASLSLHFVYMLRRDRLEVWNRVLKGRNLAYVRSDHEQCNANSCPVTNREEKIYIQNIFVTAYFNNLLRMNESNTNYRFRDGKYNDFMEKEWVRNGGGILRAEFRFSETLERIATGWLLARIGKSAYYRELMSTHIGSMANALTSRNNSIRNERRFLYDKNGRKIDDILSLPDSVFATHLEGAIVQIGHYLDHVRLDYSHFTRPVGGGALFVRDMFEELFDKKGGKEEKTVTDRVKEAYSFWTYLTKAAGILDQMKHPEEIILEQGVTFETSNPWVKPATYGVKTKWRELGRHFVEVNDTISGNGVDEKSAEQKHYQDKVKSFEKMMDAFFAKDHLEDIFNERQPGLVDFYLTVISPSRPRGNCIPHDLAVHNNTCSKSGRSRT